MAAGAQDSCGPETLGPFPQLPSASVPQPHSLFSVKDHKVLLDGIEAVLQVVIFLLVRTSNGQRQVPYVPSDAILSTCAFLRWPELCSQEARAPGGLYLPGDP